MNNEVESLTLKEKVENENNNNNLVSNNASKLSSEQNTFMSNLNPPIKSSLNSPVKSSLNTPVKSNLNTSSVSNPKSNNVFAKKNRDLNMLKANNLNQKGTKKNSRMVNQLATKGLNRVGIPKTIANKAVNSEFGQKVTDKMKKAMPGLGFLDKFLDNGKKETEEQASDGGGANFKISAKAIKVLILSSVPTLVVVIFICLFISSSQVYINAVGLGQADSISEDKADEKIGNISDDDADREITDDNANKAAYEPTIGNERSLNFMYNKLRAANLITVSDRDSLLREYNEGDLTELESFYSNILDYDEGYDINTVYAFFFKMYDLYTYYRNKYNVYLDTPLLMATLKVQDSDMNVIFKSNTKDYDRKTKSQDEYRYDYDWNAHGYKIKLDDSSHDMEVLAQHMVSIVDSCSDPAPDGNCYVIDDQKYQEFLEEFIEKKYFLEGEYSITPNEVVEPNPEPTPDPNAPQSNSLADAMINLANSEYENDQGVNDGAKYIDAYGGLGYGTPWCAIFAWYITANTNFNGQNLYPDVISLKTAGVGFYITYFNNKNQFYYNDSCSNLKGKNNSKTSYVPKKGDFIFFAWGKDYYDISSGTQSHVGIVEKYENGIVYTIEGNSSSRVRKNSYPIDDCSVIGFGSWY